MEALIKVSWEQDWQVNHFLKEHPGIRKEDWFNPKGEPISFLHSSELLTNMLGSLSLGSSVDKWSMLAAKLNPPALLSTGSGKLAASTMVTTLETEEFVILIE